MIAPQLIQGFVKIWDPISNEVLLDCKNSINYENFSEALAKSISSGPLNATDSNSASGFILQMAFGNGGTEVSSTGIITYNTPHFIGQNAALYSQSYAKFVNDNFSTNIDPNRNKITVSHLVGKPYTDLIVSCVLDYGEPAGQQAFDNTINFNDTYVFDELGLVSTGGRLLTHVVFHPIQKSVNRIIMINYTIRIQALSS